jgi:hypothetical protein
MSRGLNGLKKGFRRASRGYRLTTAWNKAEYACNERAASRVPISARLAKHEALAPWHSSNRAKCQ